MSDQAIPEDLEYFCMFKFDYGQIGPARAGDREVELAMLTRLVELDTDKKWTLKQLADALHHMVHIANHYMVVDAEEQPASSETVEKLFG
jgi:hypothetical protein